MHTFLRDGKLFCIVADAAFAMNHFVQIGDATSEFTEVEPGLLTQVRQNILGPAVNSAEGWSLACDKPDAMSFGFDMSPEWAVQRSPTLFIECDPDPHAFRLAAISFNGSSRFPVEANVPFRLQAFAACHRCTAALVVEFFDERGESVGSRACGLPVGKGGQNREDYHPVVLDFTSPAAACTAEVFISYNESVTPVAGFRSFIFLHGLSLTIQDEARISPSYGTSLLNLALADGQEPHIYAAPLDAALCAKTKCQIDIRRSGHGTVESLRLASDHAGSFPMGTIEHLGGVQIRINVPQDVDYAVFIDGARVGHDLLHVSDRENKTFRLSSKFCDGGYHVIELRDQTGCLRLHQEPVLLPFQQTPWTILQEHAGIPPEFLSPSAGQRYKSLAAHIGQFARNDAERDTFAQLERAHAVLMKGYEHNRVFAPLIFPQHEAPSVSIVIPVHGKFAVTYFCLCALLLAFNQTTFEVIIVDDGSTDRTSDLPRLVSNIIYVHNEHANGFLAACNKGAQHARGEYLVLLNNDTEPTFRWLDELVESFTLFENVGLAGSKLIYPDGRLQEAGGIVWRSGNPWNYGRLENPFDPRFSYSRDVDYASGASIMLPLRIWKEIGGFSEEFAPAYFEDTDLAFKVRDAGYRTIIAATSVVYHFEGITSGTDVSSGAKRYQEINRPLFKRKWRHVFRNSSEEGVNPDLEKDRGVVGRALFLDYATPRPDMDAGSYAAIQEMLLFKRLGYKVTFFPQNAAYLGDYFTALQRQGIEALHAPFFSWIGDVLEKRGREFDVIYLTRFYVAAEAIDLIRQHAPQAKILFCNADLHFLRELRGALAQKDGEALSQAVRVRGEELAVMRRVDVVLTYNDVEQAVILSHNLDKTRVMKLPWVERQYELKEGFDERAGLSFLGSYNHFPNVEAVEFFVRRVMPLVAKTRPDLMFHVYGSNMGGRFDKLPSDRVVYHGYVADVDEVYSAHKIFVAPLLSGAGIKGKVVAALARGIPCVLSPIAAEGIGLRHGFDCLIADKPAEWTAAIESLLDDRDLWTSISRRGQEFVRVSFSPERGLEMMRHIVEAMDLPLL